MIGSTQRSALAFLLAGAGLSFAQDVPEDSLPAVLPASPPTGLADPEPDAATAEQVALGRRLFFDPILSLDHTIACASCHDPGHGFADERAQSLGVGGRETSRNAPTLYNMALGEHFMWDGRADSLQEQVLLPIENELEMALPLEEALSRLTETDYAALFESAYGAAPSREALARSLAAFVGRLWYGDSRVDRFRRGVRDALSREERAGLWFFESRGRCWKCHSGSNFSDGLFHNTGVGARDGVPEDGRFAVTRNPGDTGRFKTPTLRGLTETAPYMHDGSLSTLAEVVEAYRRGGTSNMHLDEEIRPLEMSDDDVANLVAFLSALSNGPLSERD